jgi:hypothetical protein
MQTHTDGKAHSLRNPMTNNNSPSKMQNPSPFMLAQKERIVRNCFAATKEHYSQPYSATLKNDKML